MGQYTGCMPTLNFNIVPGWIRQSTISSNFGSWRMQQSRVLNLMRQTSLSPTQDAYHSVVWEKVAWPKPFPHWVIYLKVWSSLPTVFLLCGLWLWTLDHIIFLLPQLRFHCVRSQVGCFTLCDWVRSCDRGMRQTAQHLRILLSCDLQFVWPRRVGVVLFCCMPAWHMFSSFYLFLSSVFSCFPSKNIISVQVCYK